jgi:outer membrane protein assembly factor BamA
MLLLAQQTVLAEVQLPEHNPQCQAIPLPAPGELTNFKAMRARYDIKQYEGTRIGKIHIVTLPIFDMYDERERNSVYQFVNDIHFPTMDYVIQRQLLFAEGDTLQPRVINESERILRDNSYLSDAVVLPHQVCDESLDVIVLTRDLWTLMPKLFFSRKGGYNKYGLTLEDENILGTGDTVFLEFINDRERDTTSIGYRTKQVFGSRVNLSATYSDTTDGINKKLEILRPFYSLNANWSMGFKLNEDVFVETLEALNQDIESFKHIDNEYVFSTGYSHGLQEGYTQRYSVGFTRKEDIFEPVDSNPVTLPADRILAYPWLQYDLIEDNFVIYKNLNALHRTEDVPVGTSFSALLGYADETFNSELSQWVFSLSYDDTPISLASHLLKSNLKIDGYWDRVTKDYLNTVSTLELSYYGLITEKQRAFVNIAYDYGTNLSQDQLLTLGGDEGLRGYPPEYLLGEQRLLVNLEHRYFFDTHYMNLFRFAGVVFFDMGQTMNSNGAYGGDSELLASTGVGLRLNSSKTNIGRIVHLDLAFPLKEKDELDTYLIRITSSSTF